MSYKYYLAVVFMSVCFGLCLHFAWYAEMTNAWAMLVAGAWFAMVSDYYKEHS